MNRTVIQHRKATRARRPRRALIRTASGAALLGVMLTAGIGGASAALADTPVPVVAVADGSGTDGSGTDGSSTDENAPAEDGPSVQSSRGFKIYNLTGDRMEVTDIGGDKDFEGNPALHDSIDPAGGPHDWEVKRRYLRKVVDNATYTLFDSDQDEIARIKVWMDVDNTGGGNGTQNSRCEVLSGSGFICDGAGKGGQTIKVMEAADTVHTISAADSAEQAKVLNSLCAAKKSDITCTFTPTKAPEKVYVDYHQVGKSYTNLTGQVIEKKFTVAHKVGVEESVEVSAEAKSNIFQIVEVGVNTKFSQRWSWEETITDETTYPLQPGETFWMESGYSLTRYTGTFTVKIGHSTWKLTDATFDSPNYGDGDIRYRTAPAQNVGTGVPITDDGKKIDVVDSTGYVR